MMNKISYVTFDGNGALTGGFLQEMPPEHQANSLGVDDSTRSNWPMYRANAARDGLEPLPPCVPDLDALRSAKWEDIKAKRNSIKAGGVLVSGHWFHSDDPSRIQQLGLVIMGAGVPAVPWKTMSGAFVPMTQALANAIFTAVATLDQQAFANAESHRTAMDASADPAGYDFSAGWPAIYQEA